MGSGEVDDEGAPVSGGGGLGGVFHVAATTLVPLLVAVTTME